MVDRFYRAKRDDNDVVQNFLTSQRPPRNKIENNTGHYSGLPIVNYYLSPKQIQKIYNS